ncbi:MAG TPA: GNAT family N-acetyltransferase [Anaerolineales bacterium]|nr:GNAT family N-acetyltransferase [Anaerolineales bacterium]
MEIDLEKIDVAHNEADGQFETWIDGQLSKLDYMLDGNNIVMTHVGVHPAHRGQGVAGKLTQVALEYAKEKSFRVIPMCPYIAAYIRRNTKYLELTKQQVDG